MATVSGADFKAKTRDSIDFIDWRMRRSDPPFWGRLNEYISKPHSISLHFESVLPESTRRTALRLGFRPLYVYRTGGWPFEKEMEVWASPDFTTELTVLRKGRGAPVGSWSLDSWYTNDVGVATGQPFRGPQVNRQVESSGDLEKDWERHRRIFQQSWALDAVPIARGVPAASLKLIEYQNRFLDHDSAGRMLVDLGVLAIIASVSFFFVRVLLFTA